MQFKDSGELSHFMKAVMATACALLAFMVLVTILRAAGWQGPADPFGVVERLVDLSDRDTRASSVNVEYRDSSGAVMNLGPHVKAELRNGRGNARQLLEGVFVDCDPALIRAGGVINVSIQDGLMRESLTVQLDMRADALFVQSTLSKTQVLDKINHH